METEKCYRCNRLFLKDRLTKITLSKYDSSEKYYCIDCYAFYKMFLGGQPKDSAHGNKLLGNPKLRMMSGIERKRLFYNPARKKMMVRLPTYHTHYTAY
jgi:hypothetical protein